MTPPQKSQNLIPVTAPATVAGGLARELAYHSELSERLYLAAVRYARRDRDGKAAECLERAVEHENRADQIRELMSRRGRVKLVGLRGAKTWGKDSDEQVTLHATVWPSGDFTIHRPVHRALPTAAADAPTPADNAADPLGLSPLTKCTATQNPTNPPPVQRAPRGSRGITSLNRKYVRSAAAILEKRYSRRRLAFLTATLPCVSLRHLALVATQADRVIDVVIKRLNRVLDKAGLPTDYVAVWELQERGALHIHLLCVGRHRNEGWVLSPQEWDKLWSESVLLVLGDEGQGLRWDCCCRIEQPRASVARELSKYLSKGSRPQLQRLQTVLKYQLSNAGIAFTELLPASWISMSVELKELVKEQTEIDKVEIEKSKLDWIELENLIRKTGLCVSKPAAAGGGPLTRIHKTEWGYPVCLSGRLVSGGIDVLLDALSRLGTPQGVSVSRIA